MVGWVGSVILGISSRTESLHYLAPQVESFSFLRRKYLFPNPKGQKSKPVIYRVTYVSNFTLGPCVGPSNPFFLGELLADCRAHPLPPKPGFPACLAGSSLEQGRTLAGSKARLIVFK